MELPADLPPGQLVTPKLWVADAPVADVKTLWQRLHAGHARSGWWPLLLAMENVLRSFGPEREADVDAERFLAQRWKDEVHDPTDAGTADDPADRIPYPAWPGLAPAGPPGPDPDQVAASLVTGSEVRAGTVSHPFSHLELDPDRPVPNPFVGSTGDPLLGLVESPDSAGAVAASGWTYELGGGPGCTAVLRSWQERFGVRLCALGRDWLSVSVARPVPAGESELARRIAAEHVAFCPKIVGDVPFADYAGGLVGATVWTFWWD